MVHNSVLPDPCASRSALSLEVGGRMALLQAIPALGLVELVGDEAVGLRIPGPGQLTARAVTMAFCCAIVRRSECARRAA
jgi:hypothetical protein